MLDVLYLYLFLSSFVLNASIVSYLKKQFLYCSVNTEAIAFMFTCGLSAAARLKFRNNNL